MCARMGDNVREHFTFIMTLIKTRTVNGDHGTVRSLYVTWEQCWQTYITFNNYRTTLLWKLSSRMASSILTPVVFSISVKDSVSPTTATSRRG